MVVFSQNLAEIESITHFQRQPRNSDLCGKFSSLYFWAVGIESQALPASLYDSWAYGKTSRLPIAPRLLFFFSDSTFDFFSDRAQNGPKWHHSAPAGRTWEPITFKWVGVGKRSIASFVALDALFQMSIVSGGQLQGIEALQAKKPQRAGSKNPSKSDAFAGPQNFGRKRPKILD